MFNDLLRGSGPDGFSVPAYVFYEAAHAALTPARMISGATRAVFQNAANPMAYTPWGRSVAAACELFERVTRRYGKPSFRLDTTTVDGQVVNVHEEIVWERPFCKLLHFARALPATRPSDPKILIVAPLSGHYATLLRGTVEAFLSNHDVYITDWTDARLVPLSAGRFDLDDYIDYLIAMLHTLGKGVHVIGVCQPSVPVLAAVALMEADRDAHAPASMVLMGGPIDTRLSPTKVNDVAKQKGLDWFRRHVIAKVPFPHPGFMRDVYPGFLQIVGFMSMNIDRHVDAHKTLFHDLVRGDGDSAQKHREFYDEYLSVMDLTADFYLQTVDTVFIKHALPKGEMTHRGKAVDPSAIHKAALLTIEGENDDITGHGQTHAAHDLCCNIPQARKALHTQPGIGHYGVFSGAKFRVAIAPRIAAFLKAHSPKRSDAIKTSAATKSSALAKARGKKPRSAALQKPPRRTTFPRT